MRRQAEIIFNNKQTVTASNDLTVKKNLLTIIDTVGNSFCNVRNLSIEYIYTWHRNFVIRNVVSDASEIGINCCTPFVKVM